MQHSLEAYFLINFAVDTALIAIVARANECFRFSRVLFCGLLSASYALITETVSGRLAHPAVQAALLFVLSIILCREGDFRRWGCISVQLFGGAIILGGVGALVDSPDRFPPLLIGSGLILVNLILDMRTRRLVTWDVDVLITLKGRSTSFRALIDTGNRLREPISGLPVLIAEYSILNSLLAHPDAENILCRRIKFGALGGSGTIRCFRPDTVLIRRGSRFVRAPDIWVAAYPGRIPGSARALAPPSFAIIPGKILS